MFEFKASLTDQHEITKCLKKYGWGDSSVDKVLVYDKDPSLKPCKKLGMGNGARVYHPRRDRDR